MTYIYNEKTRVSEAVGQRDIIVAESEMAQWAEVAALGARGEASPLGVRTTNFYLQALN